MSKFQKLFLPVNTIFNFRTYRDIKRIIKREKIDIVHVHNTLNLISPSVYYAALNLSVPVVQTVHNFRLLCPGATFYRDGHICEDCVEKGLWCAVKHNCYRNSKWQTLACVINTRFHRMIGIYGKINYICLTDFNKENLLKLRQIKADKVFVKPNSVFDFRSFDFRENKLINEVQQFIYVGRLENIKGTKVLLKAWNIVCKDIKAELIICGTGPLKDWCYEYIKRNQIYNIKLLGYILHEKVLELIKNSCALILPTQVYEGFPMTIVEAYCMGTPVIGSNIGNTANLIKNGKTGLVFDASSEKDLAEKINQFLHLNNSKMRRYARHEYTTQYSISSNYLLLNNIYTTIGD